MNAKQPQSTPRNKLSQPSAYDQRAAFLNDTMQFLTSARGCTGRWVYDENWSHFVKDNPYYYPFNEECGLFALHAETLAELAGTLDTVVDFGAGSYDAFVRKLLPTLSRMTNLRELVSIDLCEAFPHDTAQIASYWLPRVKLTPLNIDHSVEAPELHSPVLGFFIGSPISNIVLGAEESLQQGILRTLRRFGEVLPAGSRLAMTWDSCQDVKQILRAYDHPAFARMERGLIARMNRELGLKGITEDDFDFVGPWYPDRHLFANELEARRDANFSIGSFTGSVKKGQRFWSGSCYKIPDTMMLEAFSQSEFTMTWIAKAPNMRLCLLSRL